WVEQLARHIGETNQAVLVAGALCSAQLGEGHICIDLKHLWQTSLLEDCSVEQWQTALHHSGITSPEQWCDVLLSSCLVVSPSNVNRSPCPMVLSGTRLYLFRYFEYEQQVLSYLHQQFEALPLLVNKPLLATLFPPQENTNNADFVDWQKVAVANAASLPFSIISGGPGTGKTTTVTKLLALLVAQSIAGKSTKHICCSE
ncbi:AAA family ATPase, partial [Marinomonas sp.]